MSSQAHNIITMISAEIASANSKMHSEMYYPSSSGDEMDNIIKRNKTKVTELRMIREQLEDIFARPN